MEVLKILLFPLVVVLTFILEFILYLFSDFPLITILLFAIFIALSLKPIQRPLRKIEEKTTEKINLIEKEYLQLSTGMNNEEAFLLKDSLYKKHSFSPFQSYKQAISFFALIPVLISVIIVFENSSFVQEAYIFGIPLSKPDGLLFGYNIFPLAMFISTYLDSSFRYANDKRSKQKFLYIFARVIFSFLSLALLLIESI